MENKVLQMSDEEIAKVVRSLAKKLSEQNINGVKQLVAMSAAFILCQTMQDGNIGKFTLNLSDVTSEMFPDPADFYIEIVKTEKHRQTNTDRHPDLKTE